jgi:hypothetical protein
VRVEPARSETMPHRPSEPFGNTRILRVTRDGRDRFEVRSEGGELLGASNDQIKAIWSAVLAADLISARGYHVRVLVQRGAAFVEEYVAKPQPPTDSKKPT